MTIQQLPTKRWNVESLMNSFTEPVKEFFFTKPVVLIQTSSKYATVATKCTINFG